MSNTLNVVLRYCVPRLINCLLKPEPCQAFRVGLVDPVLHLRLYMLNGVKVWASRGPLNEGIIAKMLLNPLRRLLSPMCWRVIVYNAKLGVFSPPSVDERYDTLSVGSRSDLPL